MVEPLFIPTHTGPLAYTLTSPKVNAFIEIGILDDLGRYPAYGLTQAWLIHLSYPPVFESTTCDLKSGSELAIQI